jgi:hypothetical protein
MTVTTSATGSDMLAVARRAIGDGRPDDYTLAPTRHAAELGVRAPALGTILSGSRVEAAAAEFERHDAAAVEAQSEFKRTALRANRAVLLTACLSALMLVVGPFDTLSGIDSARRLVLGILGALSVVGGGLTTMWLYQLKQGHLLERWNQARAHAETRRLDYFQRVLESTTASGGDPPIDLLLLEYFRRYQLDVQVAFYGRRAREHARAADRTLRMEAFAVLLATVGAGLGGMLAFAADRPEYAAMAAIGVLGAALAAYAATFEAINQDRRNAERYERTLTTLLALRERLDEVRAAAATGNREPVLRFMEAVNEQLSLEHREWLESSESMRTSLGLLESALQQSRPPAEPRGG